MSTAVTISPQPIQFYLNNLGQPNVGGYILTQIGGVNAATYQDAAGSVALPNPIPLNSRGEISNASGLSCQLFLVNGQTYTFTMFDRDGNQLNQPASVTALPSNLVGAVTINGVPITGVPNTVVPPLAVNSITSLRAQLKTGNPNVFVTGYYAAGDGGGGEYYFDPSDTTSPDNGGTTIVASDGGRWKLIYTNFVSVRQFGAKGDGTTDDTAAFNLATQSTANWTSALQYDILVPSGPNVKYKVNGTVYVRRGQTMRGAGHGTLFDLSGNTTSNSFVMGRGLIAGVPTDDAGGSPVKMENFWTSGGAPTKGVIGVSASGFEISSVFMTFPGVGIELGLGTGVSDGLISGLEVDQSLSAVIMTTAQNIVFNNCNIYLPSTGLTFDSDCRDVIFNGGIIEYATAAAVLFSTGASNIKGISFNGVNFVMNAQNASTFQGFVQLRAANVEAQFAGCSFRNMYKWAINHQTNGPVALTFSGGCVFDGSPTTSAYTPSTTAMVLNTGLNGTYDFSGCEYRNLFGEIVTVNDSLVRLTMSGGLVVGCDANAASQKRFNIVTAQVPKITVKGVVGFGYQFASGSNQCCVLPWWGASTVWKVNIKGNTQATGDSYYSAAEESVFTVTWMNASGTKSINVDKILLWQTTTRTNPGNLSANACLGTAPGGSPTTTTFATTGTICVSVAFTSAANFDYFAETGT